MLSIRKMESISPLSRLKQEYLQETTAPLDGMWLSGFVPVATHFGFYDGDEPVGFYCVNDEDYLLQFLVLRSNRDQSSDLFASAVQGNVSTHGILKGAFVSTAEPHYLSLCLDRFSIFEVNALMYQFNEGMQQASRSPDFSLSAVKSDQLSEVVEFAVASIGAPEEWLTGYYANLIDRNELFGVWKNGRLIATGESRRNDDYQTNYADVGMIVAESERGRGLATEILQELVAMNDANGVTSICSTETTNVAAQTAISRAGFFSGNRILQFQA